jgi:hypothetical protein
MNNAEKKGGSSDAFANLRQVAGLEDVWQLHKSLAEGAQNYPDDRVANLDETTGHWLNTAISHSVFPRSCSRDSSTPQLSVHRPPVLICPSISASARKLIKSRDIVATASLRSPWM